MKRSNAPSPYFFLALLIILLVFIAIRRSHGPGPSAPAPVGRRSHSARRRSFENERGPESREQMEAACASFGVTCQSVYFQPWTPPSAGQCATRLHNGYPVPDPRCTPGGVNPSVTTEILQDPQWRTRCVRNCQTSEAQKHVEYAWYGIRPPRQNSEENQVCELDHLVPLELGGADGLGNLWPQCGPDGTTLPNRYFKMKDRVENYLADAVKTGRMPLEAAQRGIASDWTQFLPDANRYCAAGGRC